MSNEQPVDLEHTEVAPDEPHFDSDAGDIYTGDHCKFYQHGKLVVTVPADTSDVGMWHALEDYMEAEGYWTDVWFISDHGNEVLMSRPKGYRRPKTKRLRSLKVYWETEIMASGPHEAAQKALRGLCMRDALKTFTVRDHTRRKDRVTTVCVVNWQSVTRSSAPVLADALAVLTKDPKIVEFLKREDPKALGQALDALDLHFSTKKG